MANTWIVLHQTILMFFYMMVGYLLYRRKLLSDEGGRSLSNLLLYIILPCVVLRSFQAERTPELVRALPVCAAVAAVLLGIAMSISHVLFRHEPIDDFGVAFPNAGFIGFPLVSAVFGAGAVLYAAIYASVLSALQWTYGQMLLSGDRSRISVRSMPIIAAFL